MPTLLRFGRAAFLLCFEWPPLSKERARIVVDAQRLRNGIDLGARRDISAARGA
jgi:hypothetical protein